MATIRKKTSAEKITLVPLTDLYERADHPIKMRDDDSMQETIESVKRSGVLTPGTVCKQSSKVGQISPQSIPGARQVFATKYTSGKISL